MQANVGTKDRVIRLVIAVVFAYMGVSIHGAFWILAAVAAGTAALGFCGLYALLGISTCPVPKQDQTRR